MVWNLTNGRPNFVNARCVIPQKDWNYWAKPEAITEAEHNTKQVPHLQALGLINFIQDDHKITDK